MGSLIQKYRLLIQIVLFMSTLALLFVHEGNTTYDKDIVHFIRKSSKDVVLNSEFVNPSMLKICRLIQQSVDAKTLQNHRSELNLPTENLQHQQSVLENMSPLSTQCKKIITNSQATLHNTDQLEKERIVYSDVRVRSDGCYDCFRHDFGYIINNDNICKVKSDKDIVHLFIMIFTTAGHHVARNAIRNTWLRNTENNTAGVRYAFLLGMTSNQDIMKSINKENNIYHDIIQEDFIDSYKNLTYKTIMGFRWATRNCSKAKFIMKTDDDMWVNVPQLLNITAKITSALQTGVGGLCSQNASPIRKTKSKWYVSRDSYPNRYYPGFCSGTGYVTSLSVATKVYQKSKHIPFFYLEDVYVALCIRALGLKVIPIQGFNNDKPSSTLCQYKSPNVITIHNMNPADIYRAWHVDCSENYS